MRNREALVTFTFDDAPVSACGAGARLLEQYGVRATYYISGGGCGATSPCGQLATAEQVRSLCVKGHEIGCHTYSHAAVTRIDGDALAADLGHNRSFLQGLDRAALPRNFAYPYGDLSFRTKRDLQRDFDSCRSLRRGVNAGIVDLGALKCCLLENSSIDRHGILNVVAETVRRTGWLIFCSHDVDDPPSEFGVSPDLVEFALIAALAAGCRLVTVRDALAILNAAGMRSRDPGRAYGVSLHEPQRIAQ